MGADIHMYVEEESVPGAPYYMVAKLPLMPRNSRLFGLLAGVRGDLPPVYPPRGLPDNLSGGVLADYYTESDEGEVVIADWWHSASWLTMSEYSDVLYEYETTPNELGEHRPPPSDYWSLISLLDSPGRNRRLVFWFDS